MSPDPISPISPEIRRTIIEAKENLGMTHMQICVQYGFDWDTVMNCLGNLSSKKIVEKDMYHQGFQYTFRWMKHRHNRQDPISKTLHNFLAKISKGQFPKKYFNDSSVQRISQFRLNRLKRGKVTEIGNTLINEGEIQQTHNVHDLSRIAKQTFMDHVKQKKHKPSHDDIQSRVLEEDPYGIAMEIPVWGNPPITRDIVTGHIDILRVFDNTLYVVDYKPEDSFMRSIPQVAFYGFLLEKNLNLNNVKCISFSKNKVWEYKPNILNKINDMLLEHNIKFFAWQRYL